MTHALRNISLVLLILLCGPVYAQQHKPALPSILIIGDNVYQQFARGAAGELKGFANVHIAKWPEFVLPSSTNAIEHIDLLLGLKDAAGKGVPEEKRPTWNLVHLNVGLGDLIYHVPNLKSHRVLSYDLGGVITTNPAQYEKNVEALIQLIRKKAPKARIVWASTTPIRSSSAKVFKPGSEVEYNQIAGRVMKKYCVPINDMHAYALGVMNMDKPASQDPFFFDGKPIHPPIVETIARELIVPIKNPVEGLPVPKLDRGMDRASDVDNSGGF
jgi:hypothetical protein